MPKLVKRALSQGQIAAILAGSAGLGAGVGYHTMPKIQGFDDIEASKRVSSYLTAAQFAALAAFITGKGPKNVLPAILQHPGRASTAIMGYGLSDQIPVWHSVQTRQRDAAVANANASKVTSIPYNLQKALGSSTAQGAGIGAAGAGLAAILTGLARRKTEREQVDGKGRMGMVGSDFLKYLLPAVVAGGVIGSLKNQPARR
jgi:hypothetical protein